MRRWSGLCFGLALVVTTAALAWTFLGLRAMASEMHGIGAFVDSEHIYATWSALGRNVALGTLPGLLLALAGVILWIREARAAKRADAERVFE